jgi:hypothetical protein
MSIALTAAVFCIGCQKNHSSPPASMSSQIVGKWIMKEAISSYTYQGVFYTDTTAFTPADYFDFRADSTLTIVAEDSTYNGKWQITNSRLFITGTDYVDFAGGFGLPILTSTDLQLYTNQTTPLVSEQKLNFYK